MIIPIPTPNNVVQLVPDCGRAGCVGTGVGTIVGACVGPGVALGARVGVVVGDDTGVITGVGVATGHVQSVSLKQLSRLQLPVVAPEVM